MTTIKKTIPNNQNEHETNFFWARMPYVASTYLSIAPQNPDADFLRICSSRQIDVGAPHLGNCSEALQA
jgi:hypothetical protein